MIKFNLISKNGKIIPSEKAVMPVSSIELAYGFGVYESIRVSKNVINFLDNHIERLLNSAKIINLEHNFSRENIKSYVEELSDALENDTFNIKILLYGAKSPKGAQLFIIPSSPLFPDKKLYKYGASIITEAYERILPNAKALSMLGSYLAYKKAKAQNAYDAIMVNRDGIIPEGTRTNFYAVKNNTVYTAPDKDILEGVTREILLYVARETGIKVVFEPILKSDLQSYDGFFITSTSTKLMPVSKIDDLEFEIPELTKTLMKDFNDFLKESKGIFNIR